jgi:large subunit ribosomal protein L18
VPRLSVHRTNQHIYAQVLSADGAKVLASASTLDRDVRGQVENGGNVKAAGLIGKQIADRAQKAGVVQVAFDRGGFKYHGRVKALADAAREGGLKF